MTYPSERLNNAVPTTDGPKGIGGWLILPILSLAGTTLWTGFNLSGLFTEFRVFQSRGLLDKRHLHLTDVRPGYMILVFGTCA